VRVINLDFILRVVKYEYSHGRYLQYLVDIFVAVYSGGDFVTM
jgi:hypothetical protein